MLICQNWLPWTNPKALSYQLTCFVVAGLVLIASGVTVTILYRVFTRFFHFIFNGFGERTGIYYLSSLGIAGTGAGAIGAQAATTITPVIYFFFVTFLRELAFSEFFFICHDHFNWKWNAG